MNRQTKPQIKMGLLKLRTLMALANSAGLNEDALHDLIKAETGKESRKDLSPYEASQVIQALGKTKPQKTHFKNPKPTPPSDGKETISADQQSVLKSLQTILDLKPNFYSRLAMRIVKTPWPQTRSDGQKMIYALLSMGATKISNAIQALDKEQLTHWEHGFMFEGDQSAEQQFIALVQAKNQRGKRKMPKISLTKLFEILEKRRSRE